MEGERLTSGQALEVDRTGPARTGGLGRISIGCCRHCSATPARREVPEDPLPCGTDNFLTHYQGSVAHPAGQFARLTVTVWVRVSLPLGAVTVMVVTLAPVERST